MRVCSENSRRSSVISASLFAPLLLSIFLGEAAEARTRHKHAKKISHAQKTSDVSSKPIEAKPASDDSKSSSEDSGLHLSFKVANGVLPDGLTYGVYRSIKSSDLPSATAESEVDALKPGLYVLTVEVKGQEVFKTEFLAIDKVESNLELTYDDGQFSMRQTLALEPLKFAPYDKKLAKASNPTIKGLAAILKTEEAIELLGIEVHTDSGGDEEMNRDLTEARAIEIRNALVKRGIDAQRIEAKGMGSSAPIASNDTQDGKLKNRRVEYVIRETSLQPRLLGDR